MLGRSLLVSDIAGRFGAGVERIGRACVFLDTG